MHGRWGRLRDDDKALAYLRQAVVNRSRSVLRHRGVVERHVRASSGTEVSPPSDTGALEADRRVAVLDALGQLPDRQREVLVLRHYLELSEAEIADALGIARGSVKSHASRGAAALRELLGDVWKDES
jgi:RNA polymerase sigma factor (sigma-70 family)